MGVVALLAVGALSYRGMLGSRESDRWVRHTHEVLEHLQDGLAVIVDIQTSSRGFVITGQDAYLESFHGEVGRATQEAATLRALTVDNPAQQDRLVTFDRLVADRVRFAEQVIRLRQTDGLAAAADAISRGQGQRLMEGVRHVVRDMQAEELRLLVLRDADAKRRLSQTQTFLVLAVFLGTVMIAGAGWTIRQDAVAHGLAEAARLESEGRFHTMANSISQLAWMADASGHIFWYNDRWFDYTGTTLEAMAGWGWQTVHHPDHVQRVVDKIRHCFESGQVWEDTFPLRSRDGAYRWFLSRAVPIRDAAGTVVRWFGTNTDVTESKLLAVELESTRDLALASVRMKAEFLANMSHEIRTPMNGVIGMTGLLLDTNLTDEQRDWAETIRSSGDGLLTIINDILDFSKVEAGKLALETLDFDLRSTVEDTMELLAERAFSKGIELACMMDSDVPTSLCGDPGRVRQVLINLVGNAIKFTERGEVIVRVMEERADEREVIIRLSVTDTGIGISEAARSKLFQAFSQADGSTTRKYGGTGLGLAISKQLVTLMGGEIGVTDAAGQGSIFWFTARFGRQRGGPIAPSPDMASLDGLRGLVVDDNATNRTILVRQLSGLGMIAAEASSGPLALAMLRAAVAQHAAYDVAILDLMMPRMDGFELARRIKSDVTIAAVALVLLPSFGQRGDGALARNMGIAGYLTKPVRQAQLCDCLVSVLRAPSGGSASPNVAPMVTRHTLRETVTLSKKLILVVEDNIVNQKIAVGQLRKLGYRADTVADGLEALEALTRISYDLVLMDCQMPEMDGYLATAEIRRREGATRHTPIVAMTASALEGDRQKCLAVGMDDYISKPVSPEELEKIVDRYLTNADIHPPPGPTVSSDSRLA